MFFGFLKMAAAAILDFRNFDFLTVGCVTSVKLRHHAKFRYTYTRNLVNEALSIRVTLNTKPAYGRF